MAIKSRSLFFALALTLLPSCVFAASPPLDRAEILGRLALDYSPSYIAHLVKTHGLNFPVTADFVSRVQLAGGDGILVDRISTADSPSISSSGDADPGSDHLAKCAELIHTGDLESAEKECRASIHENPTSPWPLLVTAKLMNLIGSDGTSTAADEAKNKEQREMLQRAVALASNLAAAHEGLASSHSPESLSQWRIAASLDDEQLEVREGHWGGRYNMWPFATGNMGDVSDPPPGSGEPITIDAQLQRCIQIEPDLASNHVMLASLYFQAHDFEKAESELQEAIRLEPDNPDIHTQLAILYHSSRHKDASIAELREAARIVPFGTYQHEALASELEALGRTPEAIAELQTGTAIRPGDIELSNALVDLYLEHKDSKSAIDELRRSLKASSLKFTDEATFAEARHADERHLAELLQDDHELDAAAEQYLFLLRFYPDDSGLHNDYGTVLADQGRLDEAIGEYYEALRIEPEMFIAYNNIGRCLLRKKDFDGAILQIRHSMELNPDSSSQILLGTALGKKGDLKAAMDQFRKVIEENPKDFEAHGDLGFGFYLLKDNVDAIKEFKLTLELNPDFPDAENNLAWIYVTADDTKLRNPAEALVLARRAVESTGGTNPAFLDTLAEALLQNKQPVAALATETQAAKLAPDNSELQSRLARFREAASLASSAKP